MKKQIPWHLIIAQLEQNITPGEKQQLTEWLSNDQHRQAYDEISALWKKTQERAKNYAPQLLYIGNNSPKNLSFLQLERNTKHIYPLNPYTR